MGKLTGSALKRPSTSKEDISGECKTSLIKKRKDKTKVVRLVKCGQLLLV
jgi:hypothetical protein